MITLTLKFTFGLESDAVAAQEQLLAEVVPGLIAVSTKLDKEENA